MSVKDSLRMRQSDKIAVEFEDDEFLVDGLDEEALRLS